MKESKASASRPDVETLVNHLRLRLPQPARGRPILMARLRASAQGAALSPECLVTGVFHAGPKRGTFCQLEFDVEMGPRLLIAPIEHLSFSREDRVAWEIATFLTYCSTRRDVHRAPPSRRPAARSETG